MSPAAGTASEQLERILFILPMAHRPNGVTLDELARALGVDRKTVLKDIDQVTAREYYHPGGSTDTLGIMIERDSVRVTTKDAFDRPVRLNQREALAVQLGLRALAAEAPDRRAALLTLAGQIEAALVVPDVETVHEIRLREAPMMERLSREAIEPELEYEPEEHGLLLGLGDDTLRGDVSEAIALERTVQLLYLKPGTHAPELRRIAPLQLVYADGTWYVLAYDLERRAPRIFRLDRALDATVEEEPAPASALDREWIDHIAEAGPAPYFAPEDSPATVRYSPAVARWVAERTGLSCDPDGSIVVQHRVADPYWLVRHVLQFAGEARVEAPESLRQQVAQCAAELAAGSHTVESPGGSAPR